MRPRDPHLVPRLSRAGGGMLGGDALSAVGSGLTLPFLLIYLNCVRGIDLSVAGLVVATIAVASLSMASHERAERFTFFYNPEPPVEFFGRGVDVEVAWSGGRVARM